ncbi:MAG TPA: zinc ribbon domain-containing protein [Pyrinomonadaceae bacterium]|nr:zinc ribbon domain-containing protein [Pyrinomonadaceae bacterium]
MSLTNCPECGHEVSIDAVACPNCGRPLSAPTPVIQRKVVVAERPTDEGFPKWVIVPIVILALVVVFLLIAITRNNEDTANTRTVNVNLGTQRASTDSRDSTRTVNPPNQVEVPSSSTTVNPPSTTTAPSYPSSSTSVPSSQTEVTVPADKGSVVIDAKVSTKTGTVQSVKNEKFYLLDKDLETILSDADLEPVEGNSLSDSFGLAVLYPDRYGDFRTKALNAIQKHIKYNATTDGGGKASMRDVKPDSYYLFGITKTRTGFAIWSSPVSIIGGENKLNLQPARLNEMSE